MFSGEIQAADIEPNLLILLWSSSPPVLIIPPPRLDLRDQRRRSALVAAASVARPPTTTHSQHQNPTPIFTGRQKTARLCALDPHGEALEKPR